MYAGVPLTTQQATAVHVVDAGDRRVDWAPAVPDHVTVVVLGAPETLAPALGGLLAAGRSAETPVRLTERGTTTAAGQPGDDPRGVGGACWPGPP